MALTESRLRAHDATTALPARPSGSPAPTKRLSTRWATTLGVAWIAFFALVSALEPVPADLSIAWWESLIMFAEIGVLGTVAAGLARRTSWAAGASLGAATLFTASVFACPATGHHAFGLWWFGEFGAVLALTALSAVAFVRTR
jgi:hypothetical protein